MNKYRLYEDRFEDDEFEVADAMDIPYEELLDKWIEEPTYILPDIVKLYKGGRITMDGSGDLIIHDENDDTYSIMDDIHRECSETKEQISDRTLWWIQTWINKQVEDGKDNLIFKLYKDVFYGGSIYEGFIDSCLNQEVFDQFNPSDYDCEGSDYIDDLENVARKHPEWFEYIIKNNNLPQDIFSNFQEYYDNDGEIDEEHSVSSDIIDNITQAIGWAADEAMANGAANDCQIDFDNAVEESVPYGLEIANKEELRVSPFKSLNLIMKIEKDKLPEYIRNIFNDKYYGADDFEYEFLYDGDIHHTLEQKIFTDYKDSFADNFKEPYSGWYDFDYSTFEDAVSERIAENL